ncbi:unnamed protein product [Pleuronectes platessa]|uniref:Uncharacterized protein n=1 Tax=Pleuronectes platessa TaxID=8262 RepID=A0A9N7VSL1_PLEPL|nr:unnamed protein product [Pleuronectes platessa]
MTSQCSSTSPPLWRKKLSPGAVARTSDPSGGSVELWSSELQRTVLIGCPHLVGYRYGYFGGARDHAGRLRRGAPAQVGDGAGQSPRTAKWLIF